MFILVQNYCNLGTNRSFEKPMAARQPALSSNAHVQNVKLTNERLHVTLHISVQPIRVESASLKCTSVLVTLKWTDVCPDWTDVCPNWTNVCPTWTHVCPTKITRCEKFEKNFVPKIQPLCKVLFPSVIFN